MASARNNIDSRIVSMNEAASSDGQGQVLYRAQPKPLVRRYVPCRIGDPGIALQQQEEQQQQDLPLFLQPLRPFQRQRVSQSMSTVETSSPLIVAGGQIPTLILQAPRLQHFEHPRGIHSGFVHPSWLQIPFEEEKAATVEPHKPLLAPRPSSSYRGTQAAATTPSFLHQQQHAMQVQIAAATATSREVRAHAAKKYPQRHLPVPKHTFKNPDSQKARRKREMKMMARSRDQEDNKSKSKNKNKEKKMSFEELTEMVRRSAREHASAARALRMQQRGVDITGGAGAQQQQQQQYCAMPMFFRAERPSPEIVVTSPEGAVRFIRGSGYWG